MLFVNLILHFVERKLLFKDVGDEERRIWKKIYEKEKRIKEKEENIQQYEEEKRMQQRSRKRGARTKGTARKRRKVNYFLNSKVLGPTLDVCI